MTTKRGENMLQNIMQCSYTADLHFPWLVKIKCAGIGNELILWVGEFNHISRWWILGWWWDTWNGVLPSTLNSLFALYLRKAAKCEYKHVSGSLGDDEFVDSLGFVIFFSVRVCSLEWWLDYIIFIVMRSCKSMLRDDCGSGSGSGQWVNGRTSRS